MLFNYYIQFTFCGNMICPLVTTAGSIVFQTLNLRNPKSTDAVWAEHITQPQHGDSSIQREFVSLKTPPTKAQDYLIIQKTTESCSKISLMLQIFRWFSSTHSYYSYISSPWWSSFCRLQTLTCKALRDTELVWQEPPEYSMKLW